MDEGRGSHDALGFRVGHGDDVHRLESGRSLMLGGVQVPFDRGLAGHSDADVACHAIADALLGAAGLGDIGEQFPDTDPAWKGIAGLDLLGRVVDRLRGTGWVPAQVDVTIHAQRPKLVLHKPAMRRNLAASLGIPEDRINVKAKTGERVGPIGREEAISAVAVALIVPA